MVVLKNIPNRDRARGTADGLIRQRRLFDDRRSVDLQDEIALGIQGHCLSTGDAQADRSWVSAGTDDEIVFQLLLITAVIREVHAGIDVLILDLAIGGDIGMPLPRIVADQIVCGPRKLPQPGHLGRRVGADKLQLWNWRTGALEQTAATHVDEIMCLAFSPTGMRLAYGGRDGSIYIMRPRAKEKPCLLRPHGFRVLALCFAPDGKTLASGGVQDLVRLWDVESRQQVRSFAADPLRVHGIAFSPDGGSLACAGFCSAIYVYRTTGDGPLLLGVGHSGRVAALDFSPNDRILASGGLDATVRLWDIATGSQIRLLSGHQDIVRAVSFSPDGRQLVSASDDGSIRLWDTASGREVGQLIGHDREVYAIAFSPSGELIASGGQDRTIRVWNTVLLKEIERYRVREPTSRVYSLAFAPDGRTLAAGLANGVVRLLPLRQSGPATGATISSSLGGDITALCFTNDGRLLICGGGAGVRLFEVASKSPVDILKGHGGDVAASSERLLGIAGNALHFIDLWSGDEVGCINVPCLSFCAISARRLRDGFATANSDTTIFVLSPKIKYPSEQKHLDERTMARLWEDLASSNATVAYRAIQGFTDSSGQATTFLSARLSPVKSADAALLNRLIGQLGSASSAEREKATRRLASLQELAYPALNRARGNVSSAEVRARIERLLASEAPWTSEQLRVIRAMWALERSGTAGARALVACVAGGAAESRVTEVALSALKRMDARRDVDAGGRR